MARTIDQSALWLDGGQSAMRSEFDLAAFGWKPCLSEFLLDRFGLHVNRNIPQRHIYLCGRC